MRWRLLLEEFGPGIVCIKGPKNVVLADALSRLSKQRDRVDGEEAILQFVQKEEGIFIVQMVRIQVIQVRGRNLRKKC